MSTLPGEVLNSMDSSLMPVLLIVIIRKDTLEKEISKSKGKLRQRTSCFRSLYERMVERTKGLILKSKTLRSAKKYKKLWIGITPRLDGTRHIQE